MNAKAKTNKEANELDNVNGKVIEKAIEVAKAEEANRPSNVIPFKSNVITVIEPVTVSREEFDMIMNYQDEETDLMSASLAPKSHLKLF